MNTQISVLLNEIITNIDKIDNDELIFTLQSGVQYRMYHSQDCCESVGIEDIDGDLQDLIGSPITQAEESSSNEHTLERQADEEKQKAEAEAKGEYWYSGDESFTWTFYKLATVKGYVTIRWYGSSNGYYSESVDFVKVGSENDY